MFIIKQNITNDISHEEQIENKQILNNYMLNLRVYTAQVSVGINNLYYIFAKRVPQNVGGTQQQLTSQSLSELRMATWRLYNPDQGNSQWINKINTASSETVQKEMAILLAEINYQMYLGRQQNERLLLTNNIMLLQNAFDNKDQRLLFNAGGSGGSNGSGFMNMGK